MVHNEALQVLDTFVAAAVDEGPRNDPPTAPVDGSCFIVGSDPTGAWAGHASKLTTYSAAGWRFVDPPEGLHAWIKSQNVNAVRRGSAWDIGDVRCTRLLISGIQTIGPQLPAIAAPSGGGVIDVEARNTLAVIISTLSQHGLIAEQ